MEELYYTPDEKKLLECLQTKESYKKLVKPYIQSVTKQKTQNMHLIADTVVKIISNKNKEAPMVHLHAIRLIKESIESSVVEMRDIVAEKVLPQMISIAQFQKNVANDDRGKTYFCEQPSQEQQQVGNSFFRLILEAIQVWGQTYENTEFQKSYNYLKSQNVKFPDSLYYFKMDEIKQSKKQQVQNEEPKATQPIQSIMKNKLQPQQQYQQVQTPQKNNNPEALEAIDNALSELSQAKQQLKIVFSQNNYDNNSLEENSIKVHNFQQNYLKFVDQLTDLQNQEGKLATVITEGEFSQNYLNDYNRLATESKESRFKQLQQIYLPLLSQQQYKSNQYDVPQQQNDNYNQDQLQQQQQQEQDNINQFAVNKNKQSTGNQDYPTINYKNEQKKNQQNQQYYSDNANQQYEELKENDQKNQQGQIIDFLESSEIEQYKVPLKSGTNFRKMSPNSSYYSSQSIGTSKTAMLRKSTRQQQQQPQAFSQTSQQFYQNSDKNQIDQQQNQEIQKLTKIIDDLIRDRDQWKNKYDDANRIIEQQNQKIKELEQFQKSFQDDQQQIE